MQDRFGLYSEIRGFIRWYFSYKPIDWLKRINWVASGRFQHSEKDETFIMHKNLDPVCENINSMIERAIEKKKDTYMRMIREVRRTYGKEGYCIDFIIGNSHDYRPHYTVKDAFLVAGLKAKQYHRKAV